MARFRLATWLLCIALAPSLSATADDSRSDGDDNDVPAAVEHIGVQAPVDAATLFAGFATLEGLSVEFTEEKQLALLAAPLTSSGHLYFVRPDTMLRRIETPRSSQVLIADNTLHMRDSTRSESIELSGRPDLAQFVESLLWVISGNESAVSAVYAVTYTAAADGTWTLTLTPRGEPLSHIVTRMELDGVGFEVREVRVFETAGDTTTTRFTRAIVNPIWTDVQRQLLQIEE